MASCKFFKLIALVVLLGAVMLACDAREGKGGGGKGGGGKPRTPHIKTPKPTTITTIKGGGGKGFGGQQGGGNGGGGRSDGGNGGGNGGRKRPSPININLQLPDANTLNFLNRIFPSSETSFFLDILKALGIQNYPLTQIVENGVNAAKPV